MPKNARCSRCKRHGHWQQDCFVGRIRLDEFFDAQGFKDARRDFAALQPKDPKQELRKKWIGDYLEQVDKVYGPPDTGSYIRRRRVPRPQNCPRSRTRLTPWLRRFLGAASAVGPSEAGALKTRSGERKSFAQS